MNPPDGGTYTLTRFGKTQSTSQNGAYFHSAGDLALWIWSEENQAAPIFPASAVLMCYGQPLNSGSCAHWQQGIGASSTGIVSIVQFSVVLRFFNIVWGLSPSSFSRSSSEGNSTECQSVYRESGVH